TALTVTDAVLISIAVTTAGPSLPKGETAPLAATGTFSDHTTQDLTTQVVWASATPAVATINGAGLATGVATGSTSISARLGTITGTTTLTVSPAALLSIAVATTRPSIAKGETAAFTATGTYSDH